MSVKSTAFMLETAFLWFKECDAAYFTEREEQVVPGAKIVAEREQAISALLTWKKMYEAQVGVTFDWPRQAVAHAQETYLGKVAS